MEQKDNQFKVRLSAARVTDVVAARRSSVIFDVAPELIENRNINYKTFDPVHAPGQIFVYQNTSARTFQLSNIKLISRTREEASKNLARLWTMRSWGMPNFGQSAFNNGTADANNQRTLTNGQNTVDVREMIREMSGQTAQRNFLGAPPNVLYLSAYSRFGAQTGGVGSVGHLRNIPVVMTQISIPYPTEVDYIPTAGVNPTPMPTIMTIDIQLSETHTPGEYETFSLQAFRTGDLTGF